MKKLLLEKPLNKITINDITEDCGVNRMTFYYHFKDIYDLVDWILAEDAAKAMEGRRGFGTWSEAYLDVLRQLQDNKTLCSTFTARWAGNRWSSTFIGCWTPS